MSEAVDQPSLWSLMSGAQFENGGEDLLVGLRSKHAQEPEDDTARGKLAVGWTDLIAKTQIQTGTLLKTDTVSFLLGAGASRECGGVLIGRIPLGLERVLLESAFPDQASKATLPGWLRCFYLAAASMLDDAQGVPLSLEDIRNRQVLLLGEGQPAEITVNLENLLSLLWRWRAALDRNGNRIALDGPLPVDVLRSDIEECQRRTTHALAALCRLPNENADAKGTAAYAQLLRKSLTRPLNLKRANFFTLNYDTLMEQAGDAEGVFLVDGFVGTIQRVFRPESYDNDLYFPADTTEGRVHRLDRVAHLYKLHGSITWRAEEAGWSNPYGIVAVSPHEAGERSLLIYPTPAKVGDALGMPYAEMFRRFATAIVRPQSVLFALGYGFGDEHVNNIIRQALAVPSFTLVIVDPNPTSEFVRQLREQRDRRIWVFSGSTFGTFSGFVEHVLPDLKNEDVRLKVMRTWQALQPAAPRAEPASAPEGSDHA